MNHTELMLPIDKGIIFISGHNFPMDGWDDERISEQTIKVKNEIK